MVHSIQFVGLPCTFAFDRYKSSTPNSKRLMWMSYKIAAHRTMTSDKMAMPSSKWWPSNDHEMNLDLSLAI